MQLNELKPEDHSSETNNRAYFNVKQISEHVKLDQINTIELDKHLEDKQTVYKNMNMTCPFKLTSKINN